ncbi:MAG: ParB N-terminal domain-containing protein, partial [Streptomycetaceae bacterium]|nr:ParB N-terminal domain-containing protein [Streptomycetaceae bacterium]
MRRYWWNLSADRHDAAWAAAAPHPDAVRVPVGELLDADSPRSAGVDAAHVRALAETDARLPPLLVHRESMRVVDGMHRLAAARRNNQSDVEVRFFSGSSEDAFLMGVRANVTHGMPLKPADRRAAAVRIIGTHPRLSDRAVARATGIAARTVAA